ncbi:dynamin-2A-like, partial [Malania oleifera]|uniref:dynamin-2A-like n=1 Tax=Malania oleifera TaxID=397392 RepID=UPI0025AE87C1
ISLGGCFGADFAINFLILSAAANAMPSMGRYPPFKREIAAIASAGLDEFQNEAMKMVVALVDMERAFVPFQHFIGLVQRRMERERREEELKTCSSKKGNEGRLTNWRKLGINEGQIRLIE